MNNIEKKEAVKNSIGQFFWIIGLVLFFVVSVLIFVQPYLPVWFHLKPLSCYLSFVTYCTVAGVSFISAIPCIIFINILMYKRNKLSTELNGLVENLKDGILSCENHSANIKSLPQIGDIIQRSYQLSTKNFYKHLNKARERIQESDDRDIIIRLTNYADTIREEPDTKGYFENEIRFCTEKRNVHVFKIISIHTKKKFKQCKKMVDDAKTNQLENFHLAYLNINEFNNQKLPKIIGVQIIEDEVILMYPSFARIDPGNGDSNPIFIKSSIIAGMYFNYHERLWSEIKDYHANPCGYRNYNGYSGYILYNGEEMKPCDNNIWQEINSNMPENERLGGEDLARLGIV